MKICMIYVFIIKISSLHQKIEGNLKRQGYDIQEPVGDLSETIEYLLDKEIELEEDYEDDEEMIMRIAEDNDVCIEIHTDSLEEPIQTYNKECEEVIRIFKSEDEEECIYQPIIKKCGEKRNKDRISSPDRNKRLNLKVNSNPDIQVLWKITAGDITKEISSCIIDCEVIDMWDTHFENLKKFMDENERRPLQNSKIPEEKKLGQWLSNQIKNYKNKKESMKNKIHYNLWSKFLEKYKKYFKDLDEKWNENFENIKQFMDENNKRPIQKSKEKEEKFLGTWLTTQKKNYKNKNNSMNDKERYDLWTVFLKEYKKYVNNFDDIWNEKFENLKKFINDNKRAPIQKPKNLKEKTYQQEKLLGSWLSNQQQYYKNKNNSMNDKEKYDLWTVFLKEYKKYVNNFDDIWNEKFENLKKFIDKNKKRPLDRSKITEEKQLSKWLSHQKQNYKNKKMVEERYNLWTEFLEQYKHYFDNDTSSESKSSSKKKSMKLNTTTSSSAKEKRERNKSELSELHQKYKTMNSQNLHKEFNENPKLWETYHTISEENEKSFPEEEIPRNRIITELNKIKTKRSKIVVDMGCGKAQISKYFKEDKRFTFTNLDHYSSDDTITSCDILNTGLDDDSTEICILSLAMWGSNCREYIMEAYRILETNGILYIIEPTKRWSEQDEQKNIINEPGIKLKNLLEENNFQINEQDIQKFSLFICRKC